jgi:hypothetical protein
MRMKEKLACIALLSCGKKCGIGWLSLRWTGYAKIRRLKTKRLDLFDAVDVRTFP